LRGVCECGACVRACVFGVCGVCVIHLDG